MLPIHFVKKQKFLSYCYSKPVNRMKSYIFEPLNNCFLPCSYHIEERGHCGNLIFIPNDWIHKGVLPVLAKHFESQVHFFHNIHIIFTSYDTLLLLIELNWLQLCRYKVDIQHRLYIYIILLFT